MNNKAEHIAKHLMYDNDAFSQWLGIEFIEIREAYCELKMVVRSDMLNGFKMAHGGISYSLSDSAFAFASNSIGNHAVSIETSISHTKAVFENDVLTATAEMKAKSSKTAIFEVVVTNQKNEVVSLFKGTVFIKDKSWIN